MDFGNVLVRIGIGATTVDARLEKAEYIQGEILRGYILVRGGKSIQHIERMYLYLAATTGEMIDRFSLEGGFMIAPGEEKRIPFEHPLPSYIPITTSRSEWVLRTGADIDMAIDPSDQDRIRILPSPELKLMFRLLKSGGFEPIYCGDKMVKEHGKFVQVFDYSPPASWKASIRQLELKVLGNGFFTMELIRRELRNELETRIPVAVTEDDMKDTGVSLFHRLIARVKEII
ncbi:sporulation protein [Marininema halotolerans]|uniref:Sporulation-control protein n=1 Tax=Marininema halotolerans TaxID=1155944 RepID=A0A1I6PXA9_9BACL|nr:sporulation protein [Marininema halotolerans]SFS44802.1 sporulation-control protein [Marininema halotolerans]